MFGTRGTLFFARRTGGMAVVRKLRRVAQFAAVTLVGFCLTSCSGLVQPQNTRPAPIAVVFASGSASVQVSQSQNFAVSVQNDSSNSGVTWGLSGAGCSGAACGTLTNSATTSVTYSAPTVVPNPASVTLTATSVADGTKSAVAAITVTAAPLSISVSISPTSASLPVTTRQQFAATVANDSSNQGVSWQVNGITGGTSGFGTISATGLYTAPASVPTPATFNVSAISKADSTKTASASVTVTASPLPISVSVSPASTSVQVSTAASFSATVQNDSQNKGVTWSVSGAGCSGAACGSLANVTAISATYNAPATVPTPATVTVRATSVADGTKSAASIITITAAQLPISVSVSPASTSVQVSSATSFSATVQNDSQNKGVTWSLAGAGCSGAACGTLTNVTTTSATYNASASVPTPATVTLTATSIADGTKNAPAAITVTQPSSGGATPAFASNHVSASNTQGNTVSSYDFRL